MMPHLPRLPRLHTLLLLGVLLLPAAAHAQFTNGQAAFRVLGQANFTTGSQSGTSTISLDGPSGICLDLTNGKMYVVDEDDHRVLRYAYPLTRNRQAAEAVLGQPNYNSASSTSGPSAATMSFPSDCAVGSSGVLFVIDSLNNRVLRFDAAHTKTIGADADGVLGQADFTSANFTITASGMFSPEGLALDSNGRLYVADQSNNRVLIFNDAASKSNGADADGVLGQADFTSANFATTASGMNQPTDVAVDASGRLYVADINNSRVLIFNDAASKSNGADADGVLGQTNFTSSSFATTASGMSLPTGVAIDAGGRLYVADLGNNRVLIFNDAASKSNGADADNVLGQAGFTSNTKATTASGMKLGIRSDIAVDGTNDRIYVGDTDNNRVLGFQASSALPVELTDFTALASTDRVTLSWATASETNNAGFEVQQAQGEGGFIATSFVTGHGTTLEAQTYQHTATHLIPGQYRFRLKQLDYDGAFEYSPVVEVSVGIEHSFRLSEAYPNPFNPETVFSVSVQTAQQVDVAVYDLLGRQVQQLFSGALGAGEAKVLTFEAANLPGGVYLIQARGAEVMQSRTVTLLK